MKLRQKIITIIFILSLGGCAVITEPFKVIWGSSTHALEGARDRGISKTYNCDFNSCYDAVLQIVNGVKEKPVNPSVIEKPEESNRIPSSTKDLKFSSLVAAQAVLRQSRYVLFINERSRKRMVVMGIPGNVNTTEVGIFFSELLTYSQPMEQNRTERVGRDTDHNDPLLLGKSVKKSETKIDISSLSSTAKERVAQAIFEELDKKFQELK